MTAKLKDVAAACGVDVSTVSRALRGDPRVAPATRAAVEAAARELAYRPNLAGRRLQAGRTGTVWFVASALGNPREREPAEHASRLLAAAGYDTLIALHLGDPEAFRRIVDRLGQGVADGALIIPGWAEAPLLHELVRRQCPFCFLDRFLPGLEAPVATSDNHAAGAELARRLLALGAEEVLVDLHALDTAQGARLEGARSVLGARAVAKPRAEHVGIIANQQERAQAMARTLAAPGRRICAAVWDEWHGDPFPAHTALVAEQDFAAMAARATRRVLDRIGGGPWQPGIDLVPLARIGVLRSGAG